MVVGAALWRRNRNRRKGKGGIVRADLSMLLKLVASNVWKSQVLMTLDGCSARSVSEGRGWGSRREDRRACLVLLSFGYWRVSIRLLLKLASDL